MLTLLSSVALLLALAAIGYAWKLNKELDRARGRLDRYNRALFNAEEAIRSLRAEVVATSSELRIEVLKRSGAARFLPAMTVREATLLHPQAQQLLAAYHLGGCDSCAVDADATLAAICQSSGIEVAALLSNLNQLLEGMRPGDAEHTNGVPLQPVKIPNVHLDLG